MIKLPPTPLFYTNNTGVYIPDDLIKPNIIEHSVEENFQFGAGSEVGEYRYNFVDYSFDVEDGRIWARAYADEMDHVFIYLPENMTLQHPDALRVMQYLKRRFRDIRHSDNNGFVTVEVEQTFENPSL